MKEPYIDHLEEIGKIQIARHREKEREITTKNFIVNTSTMNTVMNREQTLQTKTMRQQENKLMKKDHAPSLERSPKQLSLERGKKKLMEQSFAVPTPMNRSFVEQSSFISIVDNTS